MQNARPRTWTILVRRKVHIVPRAASDRAQERAVDPGHDRSVQLARTPEPLTVFFHAGHKNVLHLQAAPWMQERQRVGEALGGSPRHMKSDIVWRLGQQVVQVYSRQPGGHVVLVNFVERAQSFLELERAPHTAPERDTARMILQHVWTNLQQPGDQSRQLGGV